MKDDDFQKTTIFVLDVEFVLKKPRPCPKVDPPQDD